MLISIEIGKLVNLDFLDLSYNKIVGENLPFPLLIFQSNSLDILRPL